MYKNEGFQVLAEPIATMISFLKNMETNRKLCFQQKFYIVLVSKKLNFHASLVIRVSIFFIGDFAQKTQKCVKSNDFAGFATKGVKKGVFSVFAV